MAPDNSNESNPPKEWITRRPIAAAPANAKKKLSSRKAAVQSEFKKQLRLKPGGLKWKIVHFDWDEASAPRGRFHVSVFIARRRRGGPGTPTPPKPTGPPPPSM